MNLLLAIHAEHKQRTGHDVFTAGNHSTLHIRCDVCLFIGAARREEEEAEQRYNDALNAAQKIAEEEREPRPADAPF